MKFGNYETIESAYKGLFHPLVRMARKRLMDKVLASDVVQNVFLIALRYKEIYPQSKVWGFILYRNMVIFCRRQNDMTKMGV